VEPVGLLRVAQPPDWDAQPSPSWLGFLCQEKKDVDFSSAVTGWAHSFPLDGWVKIRRKESFPPKSSDACLLLLLFTLDAFEGFVLFWVFLLFCFVFVLFVETRGKNTPGSNQAEPRRASRVVQKGQTWELSPWGFPFYSFSSPPTCRFFRVF